MGRRGGGAGSMAERRGSRLLLLPRLEGGRRRLRLGALRGGVAGVRRPLHGAAGFPVRGKARLDIARLDRLWLVPLELRPDRVVARELVLKRVHQRAPGRLDDVGAHADGGEGLGGRAVARVDDDSDGGGGAGDDGVERRRAAALGAGRAALGQPHHPHLVVGEVKVLQVRVRRLERLAQRRVERRNRAVPLGHLVHVAAAGQGQLDGRLGALVLHV
mmetsp:Transcript_46554/g.149882  ORF Transcript_46554/g.149882 Transcript_46554/m.149882 type:complete len:217 (+) Transcript_46554:313-963(+)